MRLCSRVVSGKSLPWCMGAVLAEGGGRGRGPAGVADDGGG